MIYQHIFALVHTSFVNLKVTTEVPYKHHLIHLYILDKIRLICNPESGVEPRRFTQHPCGSSSSSSILLLSTGIRCLPMVSKQVSTW